MSEARKDTEILIENIKKLPVEKQEYLNGYIQGYIDKRENDHKEKSA